MTRRIAVALIALLLGVVTASPAAADSRGLPRHLLLEYAEDTWRSFVAMTDPASGLPADHVSAKGVRATYTSPTNIGLYIWSTLAARDLHLINRREAHDRIAQALESTAALKRHEASGQFFNWYDPTTGELLLVFPQTGNPIFPFLSSVDNGWLASALMMVINAEPRLADEAHAILDTMDFGFYHDSEANLLRGGAWVEEPEGCNVLNKDKGVWFTCHHYGALNTEPRIASYIGITLGQVPATHYFTMWRAFPDTCDWSWQEMKPTGELHTYLGVELYEGTYSYQGMRIVPSWGGSMFEALMVPLLVPEEEWGPDSWAINHDLYVRAQIKHGLEEAGYGYWGFSPANKPDGDPPYREWGVDAVGMDQNGYTSDLERTTVDYGFGDCPGREEIHIPAPEDYGQGVVAPHASFLAFEFAPEETIANLEALRADFDAYGELGFYDSINVTTGEVSYFHLALDQGMIMASIANALGRDRLQGYFADGAVEDAVRPLMKMEQFTAGLAQ